LQSIVIATLMQRSLDRAVQARWSLSNMCSCMNTTAEATLSSLLHGLLHLRQQCDSCYCSPMLPNSISMTKDLTAGPVPATSDAVVGTYVGCLASASEPVLSLQG
jgi:hypothetical protein